MKPYTTAIFINPDVVCHEGMPTTNGVHEKADPSCVERITYLTRAKRAKIVFFGSFSLEHSPTWLAIWAVKNGFNYHDLSNYYVAKDITEWLTIHSNVDKYVILGIDMDNEKAVSIDKTIGFTEEDKVKAEKILS
jgi:hypothetical protein